MKVIQWYPGHMAQAMRMMEEQLSLVDAVIFVLDARAPASSFNAKLRTMAGEKPVLYVLNKCDLSDASASAFVSRMQEAGRRAVCLAATQPASLRPLTQAMMQTASAALARAARKGVERPVRFLVAGVPNTGKSTLINLLSGAKKAVTGDKAGVTRQKQWVKCGKFELLDTPGTMPPSFADQRLARRLAYLGCINDDILERDEIALALLEELWARCPQGLSARYGIEGGTPLAMLERLCVRRGFLLRGGEFDYERGANALIDDFRKGRIAALCLDDLSDAEEAGLI